MLYSSYSLITYFRNIFSFSDQEHEESEKRKGLIDQLTGKDLFLLWWLFFDVEHTRNLRVLISHPSYRKFNHELVGFLANNLVKSVTKCTLQYNWILKMDYITAFSTNMPNLKHIIFYHDLPTDDLLQLVAENCYNLWKLEFIGKICLKISSSLISLYLINPLL